MAYKYAFEGFDKNTMARASVANSGISLKRSVEVARAIQGKKVSSAIKFLEGVIEQRVVVPYLRYRENMPHRRGKGIAVGAYPISTATEFLRVLKAAEKNAKAQEISGVLKVLSASVRKGTAKYHMGRHSGRKMKSTHLEVVVGVEVKND